MTPKHRWGDPVRDVNDTHRACIRPGCGVVQITRHEPDNWPPQWTEWDVPGQRRYASDKRPPCGGTTEEKKVASAPKKTKQAEPEIRLIELRADGFKKLKAVSIKPGEGVFEIAGKNEQGKSSVLDAFMAAIDGAKYFGPAPIRDGENESLIEVNLNALVVARRIYREKSGAIGNEVIIQYADGRRPAKPQSVLTELRGSPIADDPLAFTRLKPKERMDLLKQLVPGVDFDDLAKRRAEAYEERTQVGRDFERAKGAAASIEVPREAPNKLVDIAGLVAKIRDAADANEQLANRERLRQEAVDRVDAIDDEIDRLRAEQKGLRDKLAAAEPLPDRVDTAELELQIAQSESLNAGYRMRVERDQKVAERDQLEASYDELSKQISDIDAEKATAIATAKLPVSGLSFGEDDITLDGLPFENASSARKIKTATALLMALKPGIKVLLVREGSLLDDDMRAALDEDAKANGFIVLLETVGDGDGSGVRIVDGEVA